MPRGLAVLLTALVVTMIGFGVTLPVLPFYIVRLVEGAGPAGRDAAAQVGLLTGVYPLIQLIAAPLWGRWSDAVGRRQVTQAGRGASETVGHAEGHHAGTLVEGLRDR